MQCAYNGILLLLKIELKSSSKIVSLKRDSNLQRLDALELKNTVVSCVSN